MDTAAGGSGDDGRGNHRCSAGKGKTQVKSQPKPKMSTTWHRAMVRYLQGKHEDAVAAGEEPPFDGRYAPPPVAGQTTAPADPKNTPKDA